MALEKKSALKEFVVFYKENNKNEAAFDDMMSNDGRVDWGWIGSGVAVAGAGCFAILCSYF